MKNNLRKEKENLRNIKKNFIKDSDLEPTLKYEISKEFNDNKKITERIEKKIKNIV